MLTACCGGLASWHSHSAPRMSECHWKPCQGLCLLCRYELFAFLVGKLDRLWISGHFHYLYMLSSWEGVCILIDITHWHAITCLMINKVGYHVSMTEYKGRCISLSILFHPPGGSWRLSRGRLLAFVVLQVSSGIVMLLSHPLLMYSSTLCKSVYIYCEFQWYSLVEVVTSFPGSFPAFCSSKEEPGNETV